MRIWRGIKNHFVPTVENAYRPHLLHRPWLLFFLAVILGTEGFLVANLVARQTDQNFLAAVVPAEVIALTNTQRELNHVGDLTENQLLENAAQAKANDMAAKGYFSHTGPDGKTPWQWISEAGYHYQYAGENLAVRFIDSADVVNAWMQSPTHRENMVKPVYTEIGVGVAQGLFQGQLATYVVQYFGSPAAASSAPAAVASAPEVFPATAPAPASEPSAPSQVEGAAVSPPPPAAAQSNSFVQSLSRELTQLFANPQESSAWVLGGVAALLLLVLAFTFFMHLQVQPTNMLVSGALVAAIALSLLALNSRISEGGAAPSPDQAAGTALAPAPGGTVIDNAGAATGYSFFP